MFREMRSPGILLAGLLLACGSSSSGTSVLPGSSSYSILELPTPVAGATDMSPTGINGRGDVVGLFSLPSRDVIQPAAFLYDAASGSSRQISTGGSTYVYVSGINDARQVSLSTNDQTLTRARAFRWQDGSMVDIGALPADSGQPQAGASGINADGSVAGWSLGPHDNSRAVLWDGSTLRDLGSLRAGGRSQANGVNASGVVVGWTEVETDATVHAAVFQDGRVKDLGTLDGTTTSMATAINDSGRVAGRSGGTQVFVYDLPDGPMRDISQAGKSCQLTSVNSAGDAVGTCSPPAARVDAARAALWRDGTWIDLNAAVHDSSWTLYKAAGINDRGQIAGIGEHNGQGRAFLLTPR